MRSYKFFSAAAAQPVGWKGGTTHYSWRAKVGVGMYCRYLYLLCSSTLHQGPDQGSMMGALGGGGLELAGRGVRMLDFEPQPREGAFKYYGVDVLALTLTLALACLAFGCSNSRVDLRGPWTKSEPAFPGDPHADIDHLFLREQAGRQTDRQTNRRTLSDPTRFLLQASNSSLVSLIN